jgi:hypothetical protein
MSERRLQDILPGRAAPRPNTQGVPTQGAKAFARDWLRRVEFAVPADDLAACADLGFAFLDIEGRFQRILGLRE